MFAYSASDIAHDGVSEASKDLQKEGDFTPEPCDIAYLRDRFEIGPRGLMWRTGCKAGRLAGGVWRCGYWMVSIGGRRLKRSRVVFALVHGRWPVEVDHINRDSADDRPENLREATRAQNNQNRRAYRKRSEWPRGVYRRKNRYEALIGVSGKRLYLGRFDTPSEASDAYEAARREMYGSFA